MATREQIAKALGYPRDWRGNIMGRRRSIPTTCPHHNRSAGRTRVGTDRIARRAQGARGSGRN